MTLHERMIYEKLLNYQLPALLLKKLPASWNASEKNLAVKEYLKFMFLASQGEVVPSPIVDEVWHVHLQFTEHYRRFCEACFGKYIDHNPTESSDKNKYKATLSRYEEKFGAPDSDIWNRPATFWDKIRTIATPSRKKKTSSGSQRSSDFVIPGHYGSSSWISGCSSSPPSISRQWCGW